MRERERDEKILSKAKKRMAKLELFLSFSCVCAAGAKAMEVKKMVFHIVLFGLNDMNE